MNRFIGLAVWCVSMRALIQRVSRAKVQVAEETVGQIGAGLLVLLGVGADDDARDVHYLVDKIVNLRVFSDESGRMNHSLRELNLPLLVVSQFTLYADCSRGRRPFMGNAAAPEMAQGLVEDFCNEAKRQGLQVEQGLFQSYMEVELCNDGPVTIWLESPLKQ